MPISSATLPLPTLRSAIEFASAHPRATLPQTADYARMVKQASLDAVGIVAGMSTDPHGFKPAIADAIEGVRTLGSIAGAREGSLAALEAMDELSKVIDTLMPGGAPYVAPMVSIGTDLPALTSALAALTSPAQPRGGLL